MAIKVPITYTEYKNFPVASDAFQIMKEETYENQSICSRRMDE